MFAGLSASSDDGDRTGMSSLCSSVSMDLDTTQVWHLASARYNENVSVNKTTSALDSV
ncbi:hypothetical protein PC116_g27206 [Phytophthora cactorum]|nr:hypothetical protein Pcac1_g7023 [Phytophthora cactorum]KAG2792912.1 hypothetical protein PC111_g23259 [Phytophthora cactorum]KAG2872710.1 hypothetical protein PC114_g26240 [Phytophthora cactorum]KAG3049238.1 hypothetical protein PC122_g23625 [Phytophthora cactorum]KAG3124959.1 hypothetical protein C6341_g25973 [Phytophthora cactorum]